MCLDCFGNSADYVWKQMQIIVWLKIKNAFFQQFTIFYVSTNFRPKLQKEKVFLKLDVNSRQNYKKKKVFDKKNEPKI